VLNIDLSATEEAILRDVLESVVSDLGMEIAGTDSQDFRERLKERREVVRKVIGGLTPASGS
jgi:predicted component of type VI protein secretion system